MGNVNKIKYIGLRCIHCDMCQDFIGSHAYEWTPFYPDQNELEEILTVCEKCAKRESGSKSWENIKRRKSE